MRTQRQGVTLAGVAEDKLEGKLDAAWFDRKRGEWEEAMYAAHDEIERLTRVDHAVLDTAVEVLELVKSAYDLYIKREPSQQRGMLNLLLLKCELCSGELTPTFREPFDVLADFARPKNDDGAESANGIPRHPVEWAVLDLNQ